MARQLSQRWKGFGPRQARRAARRCREVALARHRRLPGAAPVIALTFDDGPDPVFTPQVLDVLGEHGVTATFFCVGRRVAEHPDVVRRLADEGHVLGSHTETHQDLPTLGHQALVEDLRRGRRSLEAQLGRPAPLFRPPHGDLAVRSGAAARALGMRTWLWTVDPEDWRPGVRAEQLVAGCAAAGAGDVVVLHDGLEQPWAPEALDRSATVAALPGIIATARARGLDFVGLPA